MKVAVFGTGLMGAAMSGRLLQLGHAVSVYNRSAEKTKPLQASGARVLANPADAYGRVDAVILMLADKPAIDTVLFSQATPDFKSGAIIQMGTIAPEESLELREKVAACGGSYLEAPVLGSTPEVESGRLTVMVGGEPSQFEQWRPLFQCFGDAPLHVGPVGQAAALKLALNQLIVALTAAYSYSLGIVLRRGIDLELFANILRNGPLYAPQFDKKLPHMLQRDFTHPHFSLPHMLKDVRLILAEGQRIGLETATVRGMARVIEKALTGNGSDLDYAALYNAVNPVETSDPPASG
jgi:3-hydroxyisobutyrate dehydrogenase